MTEYVAQCVSFLLLLCAPLLVVRVVRRLRLARRLARLMRHG